MARQFVPGRSQEPNFQIFPYLKSFSLSYVSNSALDLNLLLTSCPKIETLRPANHEITMFDYSQVVVFISGLPS